MLSDVEIFKQFGVPTTTTRDWKKRSIDDWRAKVYLFLKCQEKEKVEEFFKSAEIVGLLRK